MQRKLYEFTNNTEFKQYIYDYFCQCYTQCIDMESSIPNKQSICTEIKDDKDITKQSYYDNLIERCIKYFMDKGLLSKSGMRFYIILHDKSKVRLTWENIKTLDNIETVKMFWLLRKIIVDSILKKILIKTKRSELKVFSVGSTKLTSDYDITLYGNNNKKIKVIKLFKKYFQAVFFDESSLVFDTNIYGKAYITFSKNEYPEYTIKAECGGHNFYYLKTHSYPESQLMWSIIKYLQNFKDSFGDSMFNDLIKFLQTRMPKFKLLQIANLTRRYLSNVDSEKINYVSLIKNEKTFIKNYRSDKLLGIHDFISVVNFYGVETYYTRGAFLDTVVNTQMCGNKQIIELKEVDLITSILENTGFFFVHNNKTKYLVRVVQTLERLIVKYPVYIEEIQHILNNLKETLILLQNNNDYDSKYCKEWANPENDYIDILKCEKYDILNSLINIIYIVLELYHTNHLKNTMEPNIEFFNKFVDKSIKDELNQYTSLQELNTSLESFSSRTSFNSSLE